MINWKALASKIPSKIQITPKVSYEILWTDAFTDDKVVGETRFEQKQIVLKKGQSNKELILTLIHECFHAISFEYHISLTESQVQKLEKATYYLLKLFYIMTVKK